ncbi:uncharacterized protein [Setaria viridis]|uniref:uncharacterized protein n=1 Tax=Setaria viridis TaxID=4556 RepID=UPI001493AEDC|nr:uncharacterized protein LOC117853561 [Setaria viridis]
MIDDDQTTQDLWLTIEGLFHANKQSRATFLSHDFHSMTQGNSSITVHYQRMKTLADALRDVGHPIQDSQLVLNLLHGLNPRFSNTIEDIANSTAGFPSLDQARDMLTLKELRLANKEKISNSTTLLARNSSSSSSFDCMGGCRPPSGSIQTGGSSSSNGHGGKKKWQKKGSDGF